MLAGDEEEPCLGSPLMGHSISQAMYLLKIATCLLTDLKS